MSFGGGRGGGGRKPLPPGSEFNWQKTPGELPDGAPTPLFPPYDTPTVVPLSNRERAEVDRYRGLRDRFQNGPYYAVLNAASTSARQGTKERAQFDPFNGMPSYSSRYQRKKRTVPKLAGREYILHYFPRELWKVVRPDYKAEAPERHMLGSRWKRVQAQFEDVGDEDVENDDEDRKRPKTHDANGEDEEGPEDDGNDLDDREREGSEEEDELRDDDFSEDDDEMGGDYNAEQYFDAGDDDADGDGFADGGGGGGAGDEDFF